MNLKIISKYTNDIGGEVYFLNAMNFIVASLWFFSLYNINNINSKNKIKNHI